MGTFILKDLPLKMAPRPGELAAELVVAWLALIIIWAGVGWLSHCYMMYDLRKQRPLRPDDHDLVWVCMLIAPLSLFIAILMLITPDDRKRGMQ